MSANRWIIIILDVPKMCRDGHMKIYAPDSYKVKMKESVSGNKWWVFILFCVH